MFTRQIYDDGSYIHDLNEWQRPGQYYLMPEATHRGAQTCFQEIPEMKAAAHQQSQLNIAHERDMINIESDLRNLNRINTKNPLGKYPFIKPEWHIQPMPVCSGEYNDFNIQYPKLEGNQFNRGKSIHVPRFESLCLNPQQTNRIRSNNTIGLNTRLYNRDTHQPIVPRVVDKNNIFQPSYINPNIPKIPCERCVSIPERGEMLKCNKCNPNALCKTS